MSEDIKEISYDATKTIEREDGTVEIVSAMIPDCCREGWEDCPHVVNREVIRRKRNVGL